MDIKVFSRRLLLVVFAALLGLSCTKDKNKESSVSGSAGNEKKIFRYFRTTVHKSLDPMKQFDSASADIIANVYDTLLQYDYLTRPYTLVPSLLKEMPQKDKDGLTYHFTVREGVKFIDDACFADGKGRELTIDDVIYSFKRFADANVNILSYTLAEGFIVGMDEFREQTKKLGKKTDYDKLDIPGLKKTGKYTMSVTFTRENPLAFYPMAATQMSIVAREAVEKYGDDLDKHPVGTGPFYIKDYSRRANMILAKNPNYFDTYPSEGTAEDKAAGLLVDAGKQLPLVDEVHLPLIEESQPAMLKYLKGELDWIVMNKDDFSRMAYRDDKGEFHLKKEFAEKYNFYTEAGLVTSYMAFNLKDKVVGGNKALRQAIAYALDAQAWVDLLRNGRGMVLNSIVPHPIAGSERDLAAEYYKKNIEMAKKKLKEAGYPDGKGLPELVIEYRATTKDTRQDFEFVRNELSQIGIKLRGNFQTFSAFLKKVESGNYQITDAGWQADFPDAENFYQLLYSKNTTPGPNQSNFANKKYDQLYEKIRFMPNGPERFKEFAELNKIVKEEVPVILRWNVLYFGLYQKWVGNMKRNVMIEMPLKYLNIDPKMRKVAH